MNRTEFAKQCSDVASMLMLMSNGKGGSISVRDEEGILLTLTVSDPEQRPTDVSALETPPSKQDTTEVNE